MIVSVPSRGFLGVLTQNLDMDIQSRIEFPYPLED